MTVRIGNIAAEIVTITPEEQKAVEQDLVIYRVSIGLLRTLRDSGKISSATYRKGVREIFRPSGSDRKESGAKGSGPRQKEACPQGAVPLK